MQEEKCKLLPGVQVECSSSQKVIILKYLISTGCKNPNQYNGSGSGAIGLSREGIVQYANKCTYDKKITYEEFEKLIAEPIVSQVINDYSIY